MFLEHYVKILLLDLIDSVNGPRAVTRQSRLLQQWCEDHPMELGVRGSIRRKRVKWLVDRWKRDPNFAQTKKTLRSSNKNRTNVASSEQEPPTKKNRVAKQTCSNRNQCQPNNNAASTSAAATTTTAATTTKSESAELTSPPAIRKKATTKTNMTSFGSPLRLFTNGATSTEKKSKSHLHQLIEFFLLFATC